MMVSGGDTGVWTTRLQVLELTTSSRQLKRGERDGASLLHCIRNFAPEMT